MGSKISRKSDFKSAPEILKSVRHIDHVTYIARPIHESSFIKRWKSLGFYESIRLRTERFPATHIALINGLHEDFPWATMTGVSISESSNSPINKGIRRYGEGIQHVAYNIHPEADMYELQEVLENLGWTFMTPVLNYEDKGHAHLRQLFASPSSAYGSFVELVQRLPGPEGNIYDGFDTMNIDDLYEQYDDYSHWLDRHPRAGERQKKAELQTYSHYPYSTKNFPSHIHT